MGDDPPFVGLDVADAATVVGTICPERASSIGVSLMIESQPGLGTTVTMDWSTLLKEGTDE